MSKTLDELLVDICNLVKTNFDAKAELYSKITQAVRVIHDNELESFKDSDIADPSCHHPPSDSL